MSKKKPHPEIFSDALFEIEFSTYYCFFQNSNFTSSFNEPSKIFQFEKKLQWFSFAFLLRKCSGQKIIVRKIRGVLSVSKLGLQWPYKEKLKVLKSFWPILWVGFISFQVGTFEKCTIFTIYGFNLVFKVNILLQKLKYSKYFCLNGHFTKVICTLPSYLMFVIRNNC